MGWWLIAKPGDRVVCVDAQFHAPDDWFLARGVSMPKKGNVYTLRAIGPTWANSSRHVVLLCELINPLITVDWMRFEVCWSVQNFRPVVSRPTDISIFTAMLTGQPAKADA